MSDDSSTPGQKSATTRVSRRGFTLGATALGTAVALLGGAYVTGDGTVSMDPWIGEDANRASIDLPTTSGPRRWLGPELWGNRLQDWRLNRGRIECLEGDAGYELRTVGLLTREMVSGGDPGHLRVRTGTLDGADGDGFCGFLIGVGGGELDHRAAALAQRSSGVGGGFLCTYETDGSVRFREHTDEENPVTYDELQADDTRSEDADGESAAEEGVRLSVDVLPQDDGRFAVRLTGVDAESGTLVSSAIRRDVPESELLGGIALVSSPAPGEDGPRWWFDRIRTAGGKVATRPKRTFGPIAGTLYSVNESVLKLSAQLLPVGDADPKTVELRYRPADRGGGDGGDSSGDDTDGDDAGGWRTERATMGPGYSAQFRIEDWDATRAWDYRVAYADETGEEWRYEGRIDADPESDDELTVGLLGCTIACARQLDSEEPRSELPQRSVPGRYTPGNMYFPYATLAQNLRAHDPDLLVFTGDQFYEGSPTRVEDREDPGLDYLYKWYLWLWAFRDATRDAPTVVMVDDHDMFQRDLWGARGKKTTPDALREGGYVGSAAFVKRAMRIQTGHNPDPYDPTPVERGIPVSYGAFTYGGTEFALLESRKFKLGPTVNTDREPDERVLLGDRQQEFLAEWAEQDDDSPAVCLTQTIFAGVRTRADGSPFGGYDTNAYPPKRRDKVLDSLREAGALLLAGDQHLGTLVRHGIDDHADGPVQFTGPAGGTLYQRWFAPDGDLDDARTSPNTGRFEDAHGNEFRALAVANPKISFAEAKRREGGSHIFDRRLKREGYGIVRVNHDDEAFVVECWPRTVDPSDPDAEQFSGWPYRLPFDEAGGR